MGPSINDIRFFEAFFDPPSPCHLSVEQDLCLKIEVRDQAILKSTPELLLICSIQMKSKYIGNFSQKSTRWRWPWSKMHQIKKATALLL